ncbi:hypothetical protein ABIA39_002406 [Nocardia sp. GAS34]|uniref:hypothetical protein n=1 Tax=unclassified Nocardia TaxID=2637762 RepID=UPI003D20A5F3
MKSSATEEVATPPGRAAPAPKGKPLFSKTKTSRTRRIVSRVAVAGAIAAVPVAAIAVPAFADTPSATQIDWNNQGPNWNNNQGWHHDHDRDHDHGGQWQQNPGPQFPGFQGGGFMPSTGSAG